MFKQKPIRGKDQDIRSLPTYTIPEAAGFLAMSRSTLYAWYSGRKPLLVASGRLQTMPLLSFRDLEEAYKIHLLRTEFRVSFDSLREALVAARETAHDDHPLLNAEWYKFSNDLVMKLRARGRRRQQLVTLTGTRLKQLALDEVVDLWGHRIVAGKVIFPWRYSHKDDSRPVALDPEVMSGRLVITGTRIPVYVLWQRKLAGQSSSELAEDYDLTEDIVSKALMHIDVQEKAA